jgi:drug/metabolite transporter (DMT)-like permease
LGIVLALLAASLYALATLATQRLRRLAPAQIAMLQMLLGALSLLPWVWELRAQALFSPKVWVRCWCWAWCIRPGCTH